MEKLSKEKATSKTPMLERSKNNNKKTSKKYNESRDPFFRRLFGRLTNKKERAKIRQNLGNLMEQDSYTFRYCPWFLWCTAFILITFNIILTFILSLTYIYSAYNNFLLSINIIFYIP